MWCHTVVIPATGEAELRGLQVQTQPQKLSEILSHNKKTKENWGYSSVGESLWISSLVPQKILISTGKKIINKINKQVENNYNHK